MENLKLKNYNFRTNSVILLGDTHSENTTYEILNIRIHNGSDVFHVGDVGLGFGNEMFAMQNARSWLDRINKLCQKLDIRLYLNRGNHDRPDVWGEPSLSHVFLVKTGEIGIFPNGKKVLFVGGATSVDRFVRKVGESYWPNEITEDSQEVPLVDFVFSHDCPDYFNHPTATLPRSYGWYVERDVSLMDDCKAQRDKMARIWQESGAKKAFYGHFHNSKRESVNGIEARCLDICELLEFNADNDNSVF